MTGRGRREVRAGRLSRPREEGIAAANACLQPFHSSHSPRPLCPSPAPCPCLPLLPPYGFLTDPQGQYR